MNEEVLKFVLEALFFGSGRKLNETPFVEGENYFFRTVTYHCTGRVQKVTNKFIELADAAWIADSGRFTQAIKDGQLDEVEPVGIQYISIEAIVDAFPWLHPLPVEQK